MEPSSHQNRSNIDVGIEKRCFEKTSFFCRKNNTLEGSGGQTGNEKSMNNRSKKELNIGRSLDIDFCQNLVGFGAHVGGEKML